MSITEDSKADEEEYCNLFDAAVRLVRQMKKTGDPDSRAAIRQQLKLNDKKRYDLIVAMTKADEGR